MFRLDGRTALVTGASRGIGEATARKLAEQGARVVLAARSVDRLEALAGEIGEAGGEATSLALDLSAPDTVPEAIGGLPEEWREIDVVVNNAGITADNLLARMSLEDFEKVLRTNLTGAYAVTKELLRGMMRRRWGRIISVSSVVGLMGNPGQANYAASKAGMIGFSKSLARELGSRNITVYVVAPGYIETAMTEDLPEASRTELQSSIALRRLGTVDDVACCVLFLASEEAGYITGHTLNFSGKYFTIVPYGVTKDEERIDYDELERLAGEHKPKLIVVGASAYSRVFDFVRVRQIADQTGALVMTDMAHVAGLIAAGAHPNPVPYSDFVTTTTHKTLRGPRGGMILCRAQYAKPIDRALFPGVQGGPLMHVIAGKAVCLKEALSPGFKAYQHQIVANAKRLAAGLSGAGFRLVSGGSDNHLMLVDVFSKGLTGKAAEAALGRAAITVNKNAIPFDQNPPMVASGIRVGTPAVTTRGMKAPEMDRIAGFMARVLASPDDEAVGRTVRGMFTGLVLVRSASMSDAPAPERTTPETSAVAYGIAIAPSVAPCE
jgi:glycine hydroxymethyltransferase